jgi:phosphoenolpyruvate synthase/pyruvate phosphate dikinase
VGKVVHTAAEAVAKASEGVILVTEETTPDDIAGMAAARGVITITGGKTSHAAVVARGMNKPTIVGMGMTSGATVESFPAGQVVSMATLQPDARIRWVRRGGERFPRWTAAKTPTWVS